ncbi:40S ribosomal protein S27-like isoform X2 [Prionailurus iriomotensis]
MPLARDLLHPSLEEEKKKHKKKRLVQSPNSYFMDVKCPVLLQDYHGFQPCSDGGSLCRLFNSVVPANGRKGQTHRR